MILKSFLKKLFRGYEVLETVNSPINGEIKVVDDLFGGRSMIIGGVSQSGYLVEKLWKSTIMQINKNIICHARLDLASMSVDSHFRGNDNNFQCLILGLGCGNAAKIVSERFPGCKIVGVEIDPEVVEVGKKYFELGGIKHLSIVVGNAIRELKTQNSKFDLILIDLYLGRNFPKEAENEEFINGVKNLLGEDGIVIFNRLSFGEYKKGAENFAEDLKKYFPKVWTKKAITNLLIFCR